MAIRTLRQAALPLALLAFALASGPAAAQAQTDQGPAPGTLDADRAQSPAKAAPRGQSATPATAASGAKALTRRDRDFIASAAQGGMEEVAGGKLAGQKAQNQQVRALGERLVQDHEQANAKLKQIAGDKGVSVPDQLTRAHRRELDRLGRLSGADFDREFTRHEVGDHKKVIHTFEQQAKSGSDPDIKQFAQDALPTLREHLRLAEEARSAAQSAPRKG